MSIIKMEDVNDYIDCTTRKKRSALSSNAERSKWIQLFPEENNRVSVNLAQVSWGRL